ncbi:MAG: type II secretion system F family protein [Candidatus Thermoplasmatota archaeon]
MPLNNYQKMCYQWFGRIAENMVTYSLKENLEKAHMEIRAAAYLSYIWVTTILVSVASTAAFLVLFLIFSPAVWIILVLSLIPIFATLGTYLYLMNYPKMKAKMRGKQINIYLPYSLNFIAAMSSAGVTPTEIFKSLSKQKIYGEIREEALWIYRDVGLLGRDIISAIKANIKRTPSDKFREFLQGAVVTVQSGGALKPYFMNKADQYMKENRVNQKQIIESLGIMAEAYVTSAIAGVLLVIIIIPLLAVVAGGGGNSLFIVWVFVVAIIPIMNIGFAFVLSSMSEAI